MRANKPLPRFVPTLTEVVHPGAAAPVPPPPDPQELAERVLAVLQPRLEQRLRATMQRVLDASLHDERAQWQQELDAAVREAVAQALRASTADGAGKTG